jgi:hypothetical protein
MVPSDEDSVSPLSARGHDVVMSSAPERSPAVEVPVPSLAAGAVEPSSVAGTVTIEEVRELVTRQYVDFPGIRVFDLDVPELPSNDREMLEVATERMFTEPSILVTIASVSRALHQYERVGSFSPPRHVGGGGSGS